ncbi:MAG TPA: hypothetical protein VGC19_11850, partial [Rhodanobacter sp.]
MAPLLLTMRAQYPQGRTGTMLMAMRNDLLISLTLACLLAAAPMARGTGQAGFDVRPEHDVLQRLLGTQAAQIDL